MVRRKLINVDFQKLERRSYRTMSALGKEIVDKMIEMNQEKVDDLNDYQRVLIDAVREAFKALTDTQRQVLNMKFGLDGTQAMTQAEIAKELAISQQAVQRCLRRAIENLNKMININEKVVKSIKLKKN